MDFRVGLVVALVVLGTVAATGPGATAQEDRTEPVAVAGAPEEIDADETRLEISVQSNGTAEWTVEFWMRLDDNESTDAFESLRADVEENPDAYTSSFADRIGSTVETASNATGREMSADGFAVETDRQSLGPEYGVVRYTFRWHGFAAVEGDELRAGDAIEGIYLDDGTQLSIGWPAEYDLVSVSPEPDDRRDRLVVWRGGETDFVSGEPRVVVSNGAGGFGVAAVGASILLVGAFGIGAAWWYRNRSTASARSGDDARAPAAAGSADAGPDASGASGDEPGAEPKPDPRDELLSNEEQVLRLLEEYDGRMKQQTVVEELEWTDAKTSKVVSGLREEGKLESFRLGRENVLTLPEEEETDAPDADRPSTRPE